MRSKRFLMFLLAFSFSTLMMAVAVAQRPKEPLQSTIAQRADSQKQTFTLRDGTKVVVQVRSHANGVSIAYSCLFPRLFGKRKIRVCCTCIFIDQQGNITERTACTDCPEGSGFDCDCVGSSPKVSCR